MGLNEITNELGAKYKLWKEFGDEKDACKKAFFAQITEELRKETPAQIMEQIHAGDPEEAIERAKKKFPRFKVLDVIEDLPGIYRVALEEDPALRAFQYVNTDTQMVFQRVVVDGSPILDDDRLKEEDPEFWEAISFVPKERQLKPLDELLPEQLAKLSEYMYAGKPTVKLQAPRKAKEEELE